MPLEGRLKVRHPPHQRLLQQVRVPGLEVFVEPVREHRFVVVFRGPGLAGPLSDADPNREGFAVPTV